ncbi:phosphotransferase family protein [Sphingomonas immobilis]|uniref:Phosphotransferase family protein n=1 Tax=Sphingomonas immobilis TaxID=3063997 RepID=A0ABT8ZX82_9SPHN|nr:phosphotransferase family protein [Sphingomonas sp. CA1-15]MDO7842187.1 phosphotransferase family protein [Sphingomonas sp. CA1-15]
MSSAVREKHDLGVPTKVHTRDPEALKPVLAELLAAEFPERAALTVTRADAPTGAGVNNETLLLDLAWRGGEGGAVLRIDSADTLFPQPAFDTHIALYQLVAELTDVPVPRAFGLHTDPALFGRPFFFMDRIKGRVPSDQPPFHTEGWVYDLDTAARASMWRQAVAAMAKLHALPLDRLTMLERPALGRSGVEQQFVYKLGYMEWALDGDRHPVLEAAADWLRANLPADAGTGFAWGDARPQNLMFDDGQLVALLDWDMASLGGAEMDFAWWTIMDLSVTHARGVPRLSGWGSPADTMALWEQLSGRKLRDMRWHFAFAAFRAGVIVMRLAKMLDARGHLPAQSMDWKDNNIGIQYLASMLDLPPMSADSRPWPGPAA